MRLARALAVLACCAALGCSVAASTPPEADSPAAARVVVYYPAGDCGGELELELYDRAAGTWRPHPDHPRVPTGSCLPEHPDQLFNELRVRCADPAHKRAPSEWVVGAELASAKARCGDASTD